MLLGLDGVPVQQSWHQIHLSTPQMKNIYINGRFLTQRVTGVQRYALETLKAMDDQLHQSQGEAAKLGNAFKWTLLAPPGTPVPALKCMAFKTVGRFKGHLWEQVDLPWHASKGLLLGFGFTGPLMHKHQVITIHDAAVVRVPEAYSARFRLAYSTLLSVLSKRAVAVVAVSQHSAREAIACFGAPPARVHVSTEGWQHLSHVGIDDSLIKQHGLDEKPFLLAVSSPTPNKNFKCIANAMNLLGDHAPICAVAGGMNLDIFQQDNAQHPKLIRLGYVSDEQLKALYQQAHAFVFPSFYEGFGIPPLEAMSLGCPVIGSTADAVVEVCGNAALFFDPHSPQALAEHIQTLFRQPQLHADLVQKGLKRSEVFSWDEAATRMLALIKQLM
jgi:glycosyltransferase involved in cell wall biosynthesis